MAEKSYNPFKMWGSYMGAGIMLWMGAWYLSTPSFTLKVLAFLLFPVDGRGILLWIFLMIGFLIGWGINGIVRRLKK